ncbi:DMT family transporter [Vibrio sp. AK197]
MQGYLLTLLAMLAFAGNSILNRLALADGSIDAGAFSVIRLLSGALCLGAFYHISRAQRITLNPQHLLKLMPFALPLLGYALSFSYAYLHLTAGTGALILFATVQLVLIAYHWMSGHRLTAGEWFGVMLAVGGFCLLLLPSASQPDLISALLMMVAGICWAVFTVVGKKAGQPLRSTYWGFLGAGLIVLVLSPWLVEPKALSTPGVIWALLSGAVMSALGYVIWYRALAFISVLKASVVQLSVPVLSVFGGLIWLQEPLNWRLSLASLLVLGGIALVFNTRKPG